MEMANSNLGTDECDTLTDQMFVSAGLHRRESLKYDDFMTVMDSQHHRLGNMCLDWKGKRILYFGYREMARGGGGVCPI